MHSYAFAYRTERHNDETFFRILRLPEIVSSVPTNEFEHMDDANVANYTNDAVVTALQARIFTRQNLPDSDDIDTVKADGFVTLNVQQAMKLELYKLYKINNRSVADFARMIDRQETAARRLLDLRHQSSPAQIEYAIESFGKTLVHSWDIRAGTTRPAQRVSNVHSKPQPS